ncbi:MAG: hypothetical protein R2726_06270 [Acidimicrobiales bacterium]
MTTSTRPRLRRRLLALAALGALVGAVAAYRARALSRARDEFDRLHPPT